MGPANIPPWDWAQGLHLRMDGFPRVHLQMTTG